MKTRVNNSEFERLYLGGATYEQLGATFGITGRYARIIRSRLNLPARPGEGARRERPQDFADTVKKHGISKARKIHSASWATVARWAEELEIGRVRHKSDKPIPLKMIDLPEGFAADAPKLYKYELAEKYGLSNLMVRRLLDAHSLSTRPTIHELAKQRPARPAMGMPVITGLKHNPIRSKLPDPNLSPATNDNRDVYDRAARHLRSTFSNIFRCDIKLYCNKPTTYGDEHGLPHRGAKHYFVQGLGVIERENLLSIAEQRGFTPDSIDRFAGAAEA